MLETRIANGQWPAVPGKNTIQDLLNILTEEQRQLIVSIIARARHGGIHDTLRYLNESHENDGLRVIRHGVEIAFEPYGSEMYYDWTFRAAGGAWPDHQLEEKYRT